VAHWSRSSRSPSFQGGGDTFLHDQQVEQEILILFFEFFEVVETRARSSEEPTPS
jgi:hypothetical protein